MRAGPSDARIRRPDRRFPSSRPGRRSVLASLVAASAVTLAGCSGADSDGGGPPAGSESTDIGGSVSDNSSTDLDLREANVVGVDVERNESTYTFDVSVHHNDNGESGYANWWQVETLGGTRLGRRELRHAHGSEPFTRSAIIEIPDGTAEVVVRGHDETHGYGYGGQAMVVTLASGETRAVQQGSEPRTFGNESASSRRARRS